MKKLAAITLTSMMLFLATAMVVGAVPSVEVRGAVAGTINGQSNLVDNTFTWNPQNFAGFFYDIKKDLGTESLKFVLTENNKLSGDNPYGITYTTTAQSKDFERELWGSYRIIGFGAEKFFAGYNHGVDEQSGSDIFYAESTDKNSLSSEQLEQVLMDDDSEMTVTSGTPLKLEEGYELAIKSIDIDGNKVFLELSKNGAVVDSKVVSPSKDGATESDKTYYYKNPAVGEQKKLVTVGVHFKNAFRGADSNLASIDGVWQISDTPLAVKADTQYEKLTIRTVDATAGSITMDNKDNAVTLSKNKNVVLMPGVSIQTADNDTLRFFIYKPVTIEGTNATTTTTTVQTTTTAPAENVTTTTVPSENATTTTTTTTAPAENVTTTKTTTAPAENNTTTTTNTTKKTTPGFESIFALTGLLAVAYLVLSRRE
jgi:S-layer protein (TIGR01567 family)